jgi:hypothetical protein
MTCTFDPTEYEGTGMFHCPVCGEMVIAGITHPDYSMLDDINLGDKLREIYEKCEQEDDVHIHNQG